MHMHAADNMARCFEVMQWRRGALSLPEHALAYSHVLLQLWIVMLTMQLTA